MLNNSLYIVFILITCLANSQVNTNSPYSFYGLGNISQTGLSQNIGMSGISNALNDNYHLNFQNPASYSFLKLTSAELGFQISNYTMLQEDLKKSDLLGNIVGFGLGFPVSNSSSVSLGFRPYSVIGYNVEYNDNQDQQFNDLDFTQVTYNFSGNGGLNKIIFGSAHKLQLNESFIISAGVNLNYYFGTISRFNSIEIDSVGFNNYRENRSAKVRDFQLSYGLILDKQISSTNLSIGFIYTPKSKLNSTENLYSHTYTLSGQYEYFGDTINNFIEQSGFLELPTFLSAGINFYNNNNWLVGFDYNYSNWSSYKQFNTSSNYIEDLSEFIVGGYYIPKIDDIHNYWNRVQYRLGFSYSSGYLNLDSFELDKAGLLKDFKLSFGIGLPIPKNMSQLNLSCQIGSRGSSQGMLISERYINFIFSMTFNDKWFNKRKIQ